MADEFIKMSEPEKLAYIDKMSNADLNAGLCSIEDPNCESCQ